MSIDHPQLFAASDAIPRPQGWLLIANSEGAQGFHLVDRATPDRGVVTVCGIIGRVVRSDAPGVVTCPDCEGGVA
jgi:hypothetical protein